MTNSLLAGIPELRECCIFVDPFGGPQSAQTNQCGLRQALSWLDAGGMLGTFPAGEVSHWQLPYGQTSDPRWNTTAARLIRKTGVTSVPLFFSGANSFQFHLLGLVHPRFRTIFLLDEFLKQRGKVVELRIGKPVPAETLAALPDEREATEYLRWRTYLLRHRSGSTKLSHAVWTPPRPKLHAVVTRGPQAKMLAEIESLPQDRRLAETGELSVLACRSHEAPHLFAEIGRLREITFRAVGEGTGKSSDLDRFDLHYWQFVLWNHTRQEVAGGYRAANTAETIARAGVEGLYTNTLFRYDQRLLDRIGPALELGRSFVVPQYQRQYTPLLLLWKGIGAFVAAHPETAVLFGPVSISNQYSPASRELIFRFFSEAHRHDELKDLIRPRRPFRTAWFNRYDCRVVLHALRNVDDLSEPIADVEVDGKGLPILLKQYLKLGGRLLGFNVDACFSDVLDGLVMVDLRRTDPSVLARFMGAEGVANFRRHHGLTAVSSQRGFRSSILPV
jgi:putative hemolysin